MSERRHRGDQSSLARGRHGLLQGCLRHLRTAHRCAPSPPVGAPSASARTKRRSPAPAAHADPAWREDYRSTRPKVERKLAHLMRRRHGGRRARVRGRLRVDADYRLLATATNLARLAVLGVQTNVSGQWV